MWECARLWKIDPNIHVNNCMDIYDGLENLIMKSLYNNLFCTTYEEKEADYIFEKLVRKLSFISPKHLEIDDINDGHIEGTYLEAAINSKIKFNK
jgi:hypothetical protein